MFSKRTPDATTRRVGRIPAALALVVCCSSLVETTSAHIFVSRSFRRGAYPTYRGSGWMAEVYLNVPNYDLDHHAVLQRCLSGPGHPFQGDCLAGDIDEDQDVDLHDMARFQIAFNDPHLLRAERFIRQREPDFSFRTDWIDFPSGPADSDLDANFETIGDFFDAYLRDVSDPSKLDEPFGSFYVRFTGLVKIVLEDEVRVHAQIGFPIWIDAGTMAYDAYRLRIGEIIYQRPNVKWAEAFTTFGPQIEVAGLFPIEITYLNIYDPNGRINNDRAGIEIYSWHGGGLPWPAGNLMVHEVFGPATLLPPRVIYQEEDVKPVVTGDSDADYDIDLKDFWWLQYCTDPSFFFLPPFCRAFDFNGDGDVDIFDHAAFLGTFGGPGVPPDRIGGP